MTLETLVIEFIKLSLAACFGYGLAILMVMASQQDKDNEP